MVATATRAIGIDEVGPCRSDEFAFPDYAVLPHPHPAKKMVGRGVSLIIDGVAIANFQTITSSGGEAETADVTTHDSPGRYRETRPLFASEMTGSFETLYDPTHPSHHWLAHLFQSGRKVPCVIQIWNGQLPEPGVEIMFTATVNAYPLPRFPIDGPYAQTISLGGITNIRFPGMDVADKKPAVKYAFGGCPGTFLPTRTEAEKGDLPADKAALDKILAFPSSAWAAEMYVTTQEPKNYTWNGPEAGWGEVLPLATSAKAGKPGTFEPAGTSRHPVNLEELRLVKADPQTAWTAGQNVDVGGQPYHWGGAPPGLGTGWQKGAAPAAPPVPATGATAGTPGSFTPTGATPPANLAALANITASPTTKWTTGQYVTLGDGSKAHWAGSTDKWKVGAAT